MSEDKIGGISLDDIMVAAMDGLDNGDAGSKGTVSSGGTLTGGVGTSTGGVGTSTGGVGASTGGVGTSTGGIGTSTGGVGTSTGGISSVGKSTGGSSSSGPINDDVYTIGSVRLLNVNNRLTGVYENLVGDIMNYIEANRTAEAMQMAQNLVDNNMSNEVAWLIYAYAKDAWGDRAMAQKAFEQAIAINPMFALALNDYGAFLVEDQNYEKAMWCFEKALDLDPKNELYMCNVARFTCCTESYDAGIKKCKEFIEISDEKTYLQNTLGRIYVELSKEYVVDVPNVFDDPEQGTSPGFISLDDINEVRKLCKEAKSLITLDEFKEDVEMAETLLQACDDDCQLLPAHKKPYIIFHAVLVFIIYSLLTLIWGAPLALLIAIITVKADKFPAYVFNYSWCTGSDDPLKYSRDSFFSNHETLKAMADGARDGWNNTPTSSDDSFWQEILSSLFKSQVWFLKARWQFYTRFFKQRKEQRKSAIGTVKSDDISAE